MCYVNEEGVNVALLYNVFILADKSTITYNCIVEILLSTADDSYSTSNGSMPS